MSSWIVAAALVLLPGDVEMKFVEEGVTARAGGYRPERAEMSETAEGIEKEPEGLASPMYGTIVLGDKKWSFILDQPEDKPAKLYVDTNGDGDLTNDPATEWAANTQNGQTMYRGSAKVDLGNDQIGALGLYRFDPNDARRAALAKTLLFYTDFGYEISFDLDGQSFETFISGAPSNGTSLWVDRDKNGERSYKLETVTVGKPFNFTGSTVVLNVVDGELTLAEADAELPMAPLPPNLAVGQPAIPFAMKSLSGEEISFPENYKGKVVMLDFWATWCGPCIAEIPNVKAAYDKYHDQGFEVIGISFDNENMAEKVKGFITDREMPWPQLYEGKGWNTDLGATYDVSSIPFVLLVDGDTGEILATREKLRGEGLPDFIGEVLEQKKSGK